MTQDEAKWLRQVKKYPNRFKILIDNSEVFVVDHVEDEVKFTFDDYGVEFIYKLLNQLGYKSEMV